MSDCPFCRKEDDASSVTENSLAYAMRDAYPLSKGHSLVIPKRHMKSFFEASREEQNALLDLIACVKAELDKTYQPDAYNIGINDGEAAGQTVLHLHIHVIPRYTGDTADPRGGVRWIFPDKAKYWVTRKNPPGKRSPWKSQQRPTPLKTH